MNKEQGYDPGGGPEKNPPTIVGVEAMGEVGAGGKRRTKHRKKKK
jgi:hypothetical protein